MRVKLGVLGDPAKIDLYDSQFYSLLNDQNSLDCFYLIGASEKIVEKQNILSMYQSIIKSTDSKLISSFNLFTKKNKLINPLNTRIGLFPSSLSHIIKGPGFIFAPYPFNSNSKYLKTKAKFLIKLLTPILPQSVNYIAYSPLGGKAAERTHADLTLDFNILSKKFYNARLNNNYSYYYLEAGSGQNMLSVKQIERILESQYKAIHGYKFDDNLNSIEAQIVPNSIYGGGIRSVNDISIILNKKNKFIPNIIVIGNISEINVEITYKIIEFVKKFNDNLN